jgi:hypothetical protein
MLELPANVLLATHPACSERRHYQPCRRSHERKLGDQTKDDADKEPREERSCGRSQTLLYNFERPHEALGQQVPASRYRPSQRPMPDRLPAPEYDSHEIVRTVSATKAYVSFKGRLWKVPAAFCGERLAIRPTSSDARYGVFFAAHQVATIDLTGGKSVGHVPEQVSAMSPG